MLVIWGAGSGRWRCREVSQQLRPRALTAKQLRPPAGLIPGGRMLASRKWGQRQTGYYYLSIPSGSCYCRPMICALAPFPTCSYRTPGRPVASFAGGIPYRGELRHTTDRRESRRVQFPPGPEACRKWQAIFCNTSVTQRGPPMRFAGTLVLPLRINRRWGNQPALGILEPSA